MTEPFVLIWQKNRRPPRMHVDESCPTLTRSAVPPRSVAFAGPGTAGWLPREQARYVPDVTFCERCM